MDILLKTNLNQSITTTTTTNNNNKNKHILTFVVLFKILKDASHKNFAVLLNNK